MVPFPLLLSHTQVERPWVCSSVKWLFAHHSTPLVVCTIESIFQSKIQDRVCVMWVFGSNRVLKHAIKERLVISSATEKNCIE